MPPPSGQTCGQYLNSFISTVGGYTTNPDATDVCNYCSARTTDQFLGGSFNIFYSERWRNFGLMWAYLAFNVSSHRSLCSCAMIDCFIALQVLAIYGLTWFFRIRRGSLIGPLKSLLSRK